MNIAILGAGNVGRALGGAWREKGHRVTYGVRDLADPRHRDLDPVATNAEAVQDAEVVVLALPWPATEGALRDLGTALDGKVVVDATNPIAADFSGLAFGHVDSAGERVQRLLPKAAVVKAFNTTSAGNMANAAYGGGRPRCWWPAMTHRPWSACARSRRRSASRPCTPDRSSSRASSRPSPGCGSGSPTRRGSARTWRSGF